MHEIAYVETLFSETGFSFRLRRPIRSAASNRHSVPRRTRESQVEPAVLMRLRSALSSAAGHRVRLDSQTDPDVAPLVRCLLGPDNPQVCRLVEEQRRNGTSIGEISQDLVTPAPWRLGALWVGDLCDLVGVDAELRRQRLAYCKLAADQQCRCAAWGPGSAPLAPAVGLDMVETCSRLHGLEVQPRTRNDFRTAIIRGPLGAVRLLVSCSRCLDGHARAANLMRRVKGNRSVVIVVGRLAIATGSGLATLLREHVTCQLLERHAVM
jgi:hypothetical protein